MRGSLALAFLAALSAVATAHEGDEGRQRRLWPTRCYPGSHCFPDQEQLEIFKESIEGKVIVPSDPEYPPAVESKNLRWTRNPGVVVQAKTVEDVQKTVLFARHFYLNLVYSSSGVDYTGRGSYDGSLKLDISALKKLTDTNLNNFNAQATVTAQSGATWGEIYAKVEAGGFPRTLVGGTKSSESVDSFVMNGGLGLTSRAMGLAADKLRSVQVVLANGNMATVNPTRVTVTDQEGETRTYDDPELFNAIRGGGHGFGIPVAFTFSLENAPTQFASLIADYKIIDDGTVVGRSSLRSVLQNMAALGVTWGGYITVDGSPSQTEANDRGLFKYYLFHYGQYNFNINQNNQNSAIQNLRNIADRNGQAPNPNSAATLASLRTDALETEMHFVKKENSYVMNALLGPDVISNITKLDELVELMMDTVDAPTADSNWKCVGRMAGGKVSTPNDPSSFVNPKLRSALFSWTCALTWKEGVTREDYYVAQAMEYQKRLRAISNGGVDGYYASEDIEDWKSALYGANYYKLLDIKKRYDVDNYLWSHNAVGSDFELNCRGIRCPHHH